MKPSAQILTALALMAGVYTILSRVTGADNKVVTGDKVTIAAFTESGQCKGELTVETIKKTDEEWQKQLTAEQYRVTRCQGTERAFTGRYWNNHEDGIYSCVCCGTPLFDSKSKFDSGTGWPSYYEPIAPENVATQTDTSHRMQRVEARCRRCDAHLGHVFEDGPKPTGLRYCINSASLVFAPREKTPTQKP